MWQCAGLVLDTLRHSHMFSCGITFLQWSICIADDIHTCTACKWHKHIGYAYLYRFYTWHHMHDINIYKYVHVIRVYCTYASISIDAVWIRIHDINKWHTHVWYVTWTNDTDTYDIDTHTWHQYMTHTHMICDMNKWHRHIRYRCAYMTSMNDTHTYDTRVYASHTGHQYTWSPYL